MAGARRTVLGALAALLVTLLPAAPAAQAATATPPVDRPPLPAGAKTLKYRFGPLSIRPGQNLIALDVNKHSSRGC